MVRNNTWEEDKINFEDLMDNLKKGDTLKNWSKMLKRRHPFTISWNLSLTNLRYALDQAYTILDDAINTASIDLTEDSNDMKTIQNSCASSDTDPWEQMN